MRKPAEKGADVLVAGGGVAALRAAIAAAEEGARVIMLCKGRVAASGCSAQLERGIEYCAVNCGPYTETEQEKLAEDYLRCGMGVNRRDVVEAFVAALPSEYRRLMQLPLPLMRQSSARSRLRVSRSTSRSKGTRRRRSTQRPAIPEACTKRSTSTETSSISAFPARSKS